MVVKRCLMSSTRVQNSSHLDSSLLFLDYQIAPAEFLPDFDITLGIDSSKLPKTKKIKKEMDEAEANQVRA